MTIDEAIEHCKEVASSECSECSEEHYNCEINFKNRVINRCGGCPINE